MTCIDTLYTKMILWPSRASWWWSQTSFAGDANTRHAGVFLTTILSPTDYWKCFSFPTVTQFTNYINSLHKWSTNTFRAFPKIYHKSIWASDHAWHNFLTCLHYLGQFLHNKIYICLPPRGLAVFWYKLQLSNLMVQCCGREGLWLTW